ncbi:MAG: O-antigen ligase family protein [Deltaproteobacteria bacterium]|nr:O-antigen ligase family protein [Deltaproteobacteria bacterium]
MEKAAFIIYLFVLAVSPVLFGAVHTWVYTIVFVLIIIANLLLIKEGIVKTSHGVYAYCLPKTGMIPLFVFFMVLLVLQMTPLPEALLFKISPEAKVVEGYAAPAAGLAGGTAMKEQWLTLAPYVYPVRMSLIRWVIYGLFFFGLVRTLNSRKRIKTMVLLILCVATVESLYGIIETYSGSERMLWAKKLYYIGDVTGTYDNRNHFAGLMAMGIILAAAYAGAFAIRGQGKARRSSRKDGLKEKILVFFSSEGFFTRRFLIIFSGAVMGVGLVLSRSRGGIIATTVALLFMGLFFVFRKDLRRKGAIILGLFLLMSGYSLAVGLDKTVERFKKFDLAYQDRALVTHNSLKMFDDYRMAGVGVGNFKYAYPRYQDPKHVRQSMIFSHNDWVQLLAEAGVVGLILMLAGIGYYLYPVVRKCLARRSAFAVCLGVASLAALVATAIHAWSDFNLRIPANFMILTAVLAIGFCALHLEEGRHHDTMTYGFHSFPLWRGGVVVLGSLVLLMLWAGIWSVRHFIGDANCPLGMNPTLNLDQLPPEDRIRQAITWDGGNASYHYKLAMVLIGKEDQEAQRQTQTPGGDEKEKALSRDENQVAVIKALEGAIRLNPLDAEYHVRLAWEYTHLWYRPDYTEKWMPAADKSMERAAHLAGDWAENPHLHLDMGNYWVMRSRSLSPEDPKSETAWTKALWHYHKALAVTSGKTASDDNAVRGEAVNSGKTISTVNDKVVKDVEAAKEEITRFVKNFYPDETKIKEAIGEKIEGKTGEVKE